MQNDYLNRDSRFFCACSYASHLRRVRSNSSASSFRFRHIVKSLSSLAPPLRFSLGLVLLISPFFRTFGLSRTKYRGKFTALAFEDRRDLHPSFLFFASSCHITREICPPRTRLPYRRRSCQLCVVHHPESKELCRNRIGRYWDSGNKYSHSRLLLWVP